MAVEGMNRYFQLMGLIVCCVAMSAKAQDEEAPQSNQAVKALPDEQPVIELPIQPAEAPGETVAPEPGPLPPETRDPFWPVGYVPPAEKKVGDPKPEPAVVVAQLEPPQWDEAIKTLIVKGVMKSDAGYIAVINGQVTSENDTISSVFKDRTYNWRVVKIGKEGVRFERLDMAR
jgi:hypothetical protein